MKLVNLVQGSDAWLKYRQNKVGASDAPIIIGVKGAYKSANTLLRDKLNGEKELNYVQESLFASGHAWEEMVRNYLNSKGEGFEPIVVEHPTNPRFFASLDGYSSELNMILEAKFTTREDLAEAVRTNNIPPTYYSQIQWQLFVTGLSECKLVVVKDEKFITTQVTRNDIHIKMLEEAATEFLVSLDRASGSNHLASPEFNRLIELKKTETAMKLQIEAVTEEIKSISEKLLKSYHATQLEGGGIRVEYIERVGTVNYKNVPELSGVDLDQYRGKSTKYTQVKLLKGEV